MNEGSSDYSAITSAITTMIGDVKTPLLTILVAGIAFLGIFLFVKLVKRGVNKVS